MAGNAPSFRAHVQPQHSPQSARTALVSDPATMLDRLTDTLDFQGQALGLRSQRQRVIASNIANADTPGYVSRDLDFQQALRDASGAGSAKATALAATQGGHLRVGNSAAQGRLVYATPSQTSLDRNTVDMDRERAAFADNSVKYEATLRFINGNVRTMLEAIKGQ